MKKQYISPLCEDLTLTTPDLMQASLDVLSGSGNQFSEWEWVESPIR